MAEPDKKIRKKVFCKIVAQIRFTANDEPAAMRLAEHFAARRGISLIGEIHYARRSTWSSDTRAEFAVAYAVHGGWRSDFVKKIEYDATDLGVPIRELDVELTRTEVPAECPRKNCQPCSYAVNPELRFIAPADRPQEPDTVKEQVTPEPERRGFRFFRGGSRV